jgi:hypothetical protein
VHQRAAGNGPDFIDERGGEAGVEDRSPGGARGTEEEDFHEPQVYMIGRGGSA